MKTGNSIAFLLPSVRRFQPSFVSIPWPAKSPATGQNASASCFPRTWGRLRSPLTRNPLHPTRIAEKKSMKWIFSINHLVKVLKHIPLEVSISTSVFGSVYTFYVNKRACMDGDGGEKEQQENHMSDGKRSIKSLTGKVERIVTTSVKCRRKQ